MKKLVLAAVLCAGAVALAATALAGGGKGGSKFSAKLSGLSEVPAESTPGNGSLRLRIVGNTIHYKLHYEDFEAAEGATLFAHIHFGQRFANGGVSAFLCGGTAAESDKPACTPTQGTFENVIDANDVVGPTGQGIAAGQMDELLRMVRKGYTYGNVHTTLNQSGLIRGQLRRGGGHD